jgi:hypothetical protein
MPYQWDLPSGKRSQFAIVCELEHCPVETSLIYPDSMQVLSSSFNVFTESMGIPSVPGKLFSTFWHLHPSERLKTACRELRWQLASQATVETTAVWSIPPFFFSLNIYSHPQICITYIYIDNIYIYVS